MGGSGDGSPPQPETHFATEYMWHRGLFEILDLVSPPRPRLGPRPAYHINHRYTVRRSNDAGRRGRRRRREEALKGVVDRYRQDERRDLNR